MAECYGSGRLDRFVAALSSHEPSPSAGSACAVAASMAAALVGMAARFSFGGNSEEGMRQVAIEADVFRDRCLALADVDAAAYGEVVTARGLVHGTEEEKSARRQAIDAALVSATEVPLAIARTAAGVSHLAERVIAKGNPTLIADARTAAELANAVLHGCRHQVEDNVHRIQSDESRTALQQRLEEFET